MSYPLSRFPDTTTTTRTTKKNDGGGGGGERDALPPPPLLPPRETDPLLPTRGKTTTSAAGLGIVVGAVGGQLTIAERGPSTTSIRSRRSSKSPVQTVTGTAVYATMQTTTSANLDGQDERMLGRSEDLEAQHDGYESMDDANLRSRLRQVAHDNNEDDAGGGYLYSHKSSSDNSVGGPSSQPILPPQQQTASMDSGYQKRSPSPSEQSKSSSQPPVLEIPEEVYVVRKAALQVLKPLTKTWIMISVGFALTVLFGMARWTRLIPGIPFWFILLPCWSAHAGLLYLHLLSARALSAFIAEANESRQRPDSRDHLDRTEYLPLLQRSLKFGLKTGLLSFVMFVFEILIYVRLARGSISLTAAFLPLWLLVIGGILDGLICKTQHALRVLCWMLAFAAMVLTVMKVDYGYDDVRWRVVFSPLVAVLTIASGSLIYIVYGHQIGYYRLTESQLTAGNLYSLAALICIVLLVMIGEVIPLSRPVEVETRLFVVILAPLIVCLVGMAAWVVSRDEFGRLLLYGGPAAVHPMKLRWEAKGWTCVQGKGVTVIPMFGEVIFLPLERKPADRFVELCSRCSCTCYPYEELQGEDTVFLDEDLRQHPYLDPSPARGSRGRRSAVRNL